MNLRFSQKQNFPVNIRHADIDPSCDCATRWRHCRCSAVSDCTPCWSFYTMTFHTTIHPDSRYSYMYSLTSWQLAFIACCFSGDLRPNEGNPMHHTRINPSATDVETLRMAPQKFVSISGLRAPRD